MNTSVISGKGWVVVPQELRNRYGLKKGDRVHVIDYGGVLSLVPVSKSPIKQARGMLRGETSLVEALVEARKEEAARGK